MRVRFAALSARERLARESFGGRLARRLVMHDRSPAVSCCPSKTVRPSLGRRAALLARDRAGAPPIWLAAFGRHDVGMGHSPLAMRARDRASRRRHAAGSHPNAVDQRARPATRRNPVRPTCPRLNAFGSTRVLDSMTPTAVRETTIVSRAGDLSQREDEIHFGSIFVNHASYAF